MVRETLKLFALLSIVFTAAGCAVNRATAEVDADTELEQIKSVHVIRSVSDGRGINKIIMDNFKARGLIATTSDEKIENVDAIVTYVDKWMWDLTMYMIELTITLRDPTGDYPLAHGNSFHTSLTRKSPPEMVAEIINNIYQEGRAP